jgi:hypothetical protein
MATVAFMLALRSCRGDASDQRVPCRTDDLVELLDEMVETNERVERLLRARV